MNLKESYQYQNYLSMLFTQTNSYLGLEHIITNTIRTHYKSKVCDGANDETVDETVERPFGNVSVDTLIDFVCAIIEERTKLGVAIADAKGMAKYTVHIDDFDIDAELSANKYRHQLIANLTYMADRKEEVIRKSKGFDYKFNAEGNQVEYFYPVEDKITIAFDRNKLRATLKALKNEANTKSMLADKVMLNTVVHFEPAFDVNDSYMDALNAFDRRNNKKDLLDDGEFIFE